MNNERAAVFIVHPSSFIVAGAQNVKKDAIIGVSAILVISILTFGLAAMRPPFQPTRSTPFSIGPVGERVTGRIVMRINDEPVTEAEFQAAFDQLPDDLKRQFATGPGKQAFAEQLIRMKLLEQEARHLGLDREPKIEAQLAAQRTSALATAAADKLVGAPTSQAVQSFYNANRQRFETLDLSHILIAYAGGTVPPRDGKAPPSEVVAMNRALEVYRRLKAGADFATVANRVSDDVGSAEGGGRIGEVHR